MSTEPIKFCLFYFRPIWKMITLHKYSRWNRSSQNLIDQYKLWQKQLIFCADRHQLQATLHETRRRGVKWKHSGPRIQLIQLVDSISLMPWLVLQPQISAPFYRWSLEQQNSLNYEPLSAKHIATKSLPGDKFETSKYNVKQQPVEPRQSAVNIRVVLPEVWRPAREQLW